MKILVSFSSQKTNILYTLKEAWEGYYSLALFNPALLGHEEFHRSWNPNQEKEPYWFLDWESSPLMDLLPSEVVVFCTSGTTGRIKQVVIKKDACRFNQETIYNYLGLDKSFTIIGLPPLFHTFGFNLCYLQSLEKGLQYKAFDKFNAQAVRNVLERSERVLLPLVPRMIESFDFAPLPEVEGCSVIGGDIVRTDHIEKMKKLFPKMRHTIGYGMTEAGPAITHSSFIEKTSNGLIGLPLPNIKTEIKEGILWFSSPGQASWIREAGGNWEETEGKLLSTGDIVSKGQEGLFFRVRQKEALKRKGETLFPREIELLLKKDLSFELDMKLKMKGEKLILYVEDRLSTSQMDLIKMATLILPSIYRPDEIEKTRFMRNALGKIAS